MGTMQWMQHFEASVSRHRDIRWEQGVQLDPALAEPVLQSLQTFQRGLTSPGIHLRTKVRQTCPREYSECVDLYVAEKAVHADLLMKVLWEAGSGPAKRAWSDFLFRRVRRRFDYTKELMVLLTVEMASMPFFRILANQVGCPLITDVIEEILEDQAYHVGFHIDHLREALEGRGGIEKLAIQQFWGGIFATSLSVVMADNREVFEALDYPKLSYWTDARNLFAQVQTGLFGSPHLNTVLGRDPRIQFAI